jgi:hypothetical protein
LDLLIPWPFFGIAMVMVFFSSFLASYHRACIPNGGTLADESFSRAERFGRKDVEGFCKLGYCAFSERLKTGRV